MCIRDSFQSSALSLTILLAVITGCTASRTKYSGITSVRKYQKNIPFVYKNNITLVAPDLGKNDKGTINAKMCIRDRLVSLPDAAKG